MAEDDKKSPQGFGANSAIFVALFATGAYFYAQQAPLTVVRPPPLETRIEEKFNAQDVEARLWQDPFDTVARQIKTADPKEKQDCEQAWSARKELRALVAPLHCRSPLIRANGEFRSDANRVRVIGVTVPGAPYFEDAEMRRRLRYAVLSGLHLEGYEPRNEQHIGYFRPEDEHESGLPIAVPFEWFNDERNGSEPVLLLWIDEDVLSDDDAPLDKLLQLKRKLCENGAISICEGFSFRILGPYSSGVLKDLTQQIAKNVGAKQEIQFYSYGATASESSLPGSRGLPENVFRTIGEDVVLARAVAEELKLRKVKRHGNIKPHVALVTDRDTLYGRMIAQAFDKAFTDLETERITYLRGLDGILPAGARGGQSTRKEEENGRDAKDSSKSRDGSKTFEQAFGQDQFDYLRRLAARLKEKDEEFRRRGEGGIRAIGVLGNDVFDKLLVLRALKPLFPEAVFFTTDYDAALAGQDELQWTRNLIVASSYGPTAAEDLQKDIPPFRSTYQTSAFLAARLAAKKEGSPDSIDLRKKIVNGTAYPLAFEIDRRGAFLALPLKAASNAGALLGDDEIHPVIPPLYAKLSGWSTVGIVAMLLLATAILAFFHHNKTLIPFLRSTCLGLGGILLLGTVLIMGWGFYADAATESGMGEPIAWTQGVSIWPSIALRAIAGILALCLVLDAWWELQRNLGKLHDRFFKCARKTPDSNTPAEASEPLEDGGSLWNSVSYRLPQPTDNNDKVQVDKIWAAYVAKSGLAPVAVRIGFFVILMFTLFASLTLIFDRPNVPSRGELGELYNLVTPPVVTLTLVLIFLVFDSTLLCLLFVDALRKHKTVWPANTHEIFRDKLEFEDPLLDEWLDLDFLALRTKCISKLIYFPFAIFALLIMSRSTAFADFALSPPIVATQIVGFVIVFGCAMALCFSAEKARETVKTRLTKRLVAVKGADGSAKKVSQLETLLKLVDGLRQGSFVPLSQQPPIRALLLPIGSLGWTALLDYRLLPGL
jgi:hypothetical protein